MKSLQKFTVKEVSVKDLMHKELLKPAMDRSKRVVHASDLTNQNRKFCPREVSLCRQFKLPPQARTVAPAMRITWDEGRDKQWRVNNDYLRGHMVGDWRCQSCGTTRTWTKYPAEAGLCTTHRPHEWEYVEPVIRHPAGFVGSIDGVLDFGLPQYRMLEVKIIKGDEFKILKAPLAEHRVRTRLYLRLIADAPQAKFRAINANVAHILYLMRGYGAKDDSGQVTPLKEFTITRDDTEVEHYIEASLKVKLASKNGTFPKGVCASAFDNRAQGCPVAVQCFSGKYPAEAT